MSKLRDKVEIPLRAWILSTVVTRIAKPPQVEVTQRYVAEPHIVDVPTRHGPVRCFITRPAADAPLATNTAHPPVHLNTHGGGFLVGAPRQDDHIVRAIAGEVGAVVINIDYSTAPKHRFPVAVEQCFDILRWASRSGETMGWDGERLSIGGTSAGGNLALGMLELARRAGGPHVRTAALIVPLVNFWAKAADFAATPPKPFVDESLMRTVLKTYFTDESQADDPLASVDLGDTTGLPPLLIIGAERDSLRHQIERYVAAAKANGVDVTYRLIEGVDHDFSTSGSSVVRPQQIETIDYICDHLLEHFGADGRP
ncbi:alpha/beta hydrolase [Nocardia sp. NPDC050378]|uniref:alpha/beta hydrolase n=1 Tax=Nocardia sp. NPDC050378 TaxID=3155400 RepID=UPI0033C2AAE2